ncbi:MAG TPA: hypothetical protein VLB85_13935 [Acidimicrobiia bacterium]|nr:hypothetical protein [Acidimicrobiia bacterium]
MNSSTPRKLWATLEPIHSMIYFVPEALATWSEMGFTHPRMGYFAQRSAAMGAVEASVVSATFYNFNPATVERFIPAAWDIAPPADIIEHRYRAADQALRRLLGGAVDSAEMEWAAETALTAAEGCRPDGRPLFAGHAGVAAPDQPHLRLWHAATLLREFRGDGHVIALTAAGVSGLEAVVSYSATGDLFDEDFFRRSRGWSDQEWAAGEDSLRERGWLDTEGGLTSAGRAARDGIEQETDRLAAAPWQALESGAADRLATTVGPWARLILEADVLGGGGRNVRVLSDAV